MKTILKLIKNNYDLLTIFNSIIRTGRVITPGYVGLFIFW